MISSVVGNVVNRSLTTSNRNSLFVLRKEKAQIQPDQKKGNSLAPVAQTVKPLYRFTYHRLSNIYISYRNYFCMNKVNHPVNHNPLLLNTKIVFFVTRGRPA